MEHKETGCQAPEGPILCINNCGFFGSAATMNMCSKCHKEMALKQERAELAASSIGNLINGSSSSSSGKELLVTSGNVDLSVAAAEENTSISSLSDALALMKDDEAKPKDPSRCHSCKKRVGLTGFNCRCGNTFCGVHRYSEKHDCPFDYRTEARCGNTFCGVHFQLCPDELKMACMVFSSIMC